MTLHVGSFLIASLLMISAFLPFLQASAQSISLEQELQQQEQKKSIFKSYLTQPQMAVPVGIASYGLYKTTNGYEPYVVTTDKIIAMATINSLQANVVQPQPNTSAYRSYVQIPSSNSNCISGSDYEISKKDVDNGGNLQFNVMMLVKTSSGLQTIWLQDTARFNTASMTVNAPHDIVGNLTSTNSENLAYGSGWSTKGHGPNALYEYEGSCYPYKLPLTIVYEIDVQKVSNSLVKVVFKNNGISFDTVSLPIHNVESAYIVVNPHRLVFNQISYDSELVWTGYCCNQESSFVNMDSTLSMYYEGGDGKMHYFPSLFTFGTETGESATNLLVKEDPHGGHVVIGQNDNSFLEER